MKINGTLETGTHKVTSGRACGTDLYRDRRWGSACGLLCGWKADDCGAAEGDGVKRINDNPTILSHKPSGLTIRMAIFELKKFSLKFGFGKE